MPILGRAARMAGFIPVERQTRSSRSRRWTRRRAALARGESFLVFPEGTRSRTGEMQPFKKGGFIMAIKAQVPVVPVAIEGGREAMAKGSAIIRPVTVRVRVGQSIDTDWDDVRRPGPAGGRGTRGNPAAAGQDGSELRT